MARPPLVASLLPILILVLGFAYRPPVSSDLANWLTTVSFVISVVGFGYTAFVLYQLWIEARSRRRETDEVTITIHLGAESESLSYRPLRRDVSRAEIQGVLGMYNPQRFDPSAMDLLEALSRGVLKDIASARTDRLDLALDPSQESSRSLFDQVRAIEQRLRAGQRTDL